MESTQIRDRKNGSHEAQNTALLACGVLNGEAVILGTTNQFGSLVPFTVSLRTVSKNSSKLPPILTRGTCPPASYCLPIARARRSFSSMGGVGPPPPSPFPKSSRELAKHGQEANRCGVTSLTCHIQIFMPSRALTDVIHVASDASGSADGWEVGTDRTESCNCPLESCESKLVSRPGRPN